MHPQTENSVGPALRRRACAARRLPPLAERCGPPLAAHDPVLAWPRQPTKPGTYGLTDGELRREVRRLQAAGWADWEVVAVLARPRSAS